MRDRLSMLIAAVLLGLVTATSYWYSREMRRPVQRSAPAPGTPDFIVDHVVLTQFDDTGQARYKLFAERLTHFNENDDIELGKPRLVSLQPDQPQVQASSRSARVTNAGEKVLMQGDVVLTRAAGGREPRLTIHTEQMTALPDEERFFSEVPALIERGDSRLSGAAMDYDNLRRVLTVTGGLRGTLAPADR
jgi:lipopolysaccharide export system protein LptC